jgi:aspartate kinase
VKIFKFGGAALQHASVIKAIPLLLQEETDKELVLVVSAMGSITRQLEAIFQAFLRAQTYQPALDQVYQFHLTLAQELLSSNLPLIQAELSDWKQRVAQELAIPCQANNIEQRYSQLIAWGELLSSKIVYYYLIEAKLPCIYLDARTYIKTKSGFMNALLDEESTHMLIYRHLTPLLKDYAIILTQGFIGSDAKGHTTTLGKEGSDFTGAILASALKAHSLTIWKDVSGIMNVDPKLSDKAVQFSTLSYETMAQMSFYGAQVVHPNTIASLAQHNIPLYVRSFKDKKAKGTHVSHNVLPTVGQPIYILKKEQLFVKLSVGNFNFFEEKVLAIVFTQLAEIGLRAHFIERTPYILSLCLNDDGIQTNQWIEVMKQHFQVSSWNNTMLLTIMGLDSPPQAEKINIVQDKTVLAQQYTSAAYQIVFTESLEQPI